MGFCNYEFLLNLVSYSYYEVYTNAQRAFSGLGFPYGSDEDAAYIITWLEVCGLDGINLLDAKISELDNSFDVNIDPSKIKIDFDCENKSMLVIGPGLIDYLISKLNSSERFSLLLKNCNDPIFLVPLLYKYLKKKINSQLINSKREIVASLSKNIISLQKKISTKDILSNYNLLITNKEINQEFLDININTEEINKSLSKGLNPNEKSWDQISEIAFRTFVPESEESRLKGAGGGYSND